MEEDVDVERERLWIDPLQVLPTELAFLILEKLTPADIVTSCMAVSVQVIVVQFVVTIYHIV